MTLTLAEVEHIAELARLNLSEAEKERYRQQLSAILDYAARLQKLDTSGVLPTAAGAHAQTALRPDESRPGLSASAVLGNAPQTTAGQFRVPPVLDEP